MLRKILTLVSLWILFCQTALADQLTLENLNRWLACRYLINPLSQVKNNDLLLTTGFRFSFSN